jgi:hypothetical protein
MRREFFAGTLIAVGMLLLVARPATAQEVTAEVRTWAGQTWRLSEPWIEVFYTVMPKPKEGEVAPAPMAGPMAGPQPGAGEGGPLPELRGSLKSLQGVFEAGPEPKRAQREVDVLTLTKAGVEVRVPVRQIVNLEFVRQRVAGSPLPPYVVDTHYRYSAVATLADGARVEADYFNFGTAVVRGMTTAGRVEIGFDEIESLRFTQ